MQVPKCKPNTWGVKDEATVEGDEEAMKREEVKKASDSEPYSVPTTGDFYQHDNRFQGQEDGNHRYQRFKTLRLVSSLLVPLFI
jgi:hypothetical protein